MSIRTTLAVVALAACAATPASAVTVTYDKEHTVTPSSGGGRADFGARVQADTGFGTYSVCAWDLAVEFDAFNGAGLESGYTGTGC